MLLSVIPANGVLTMNDWSLLLKTLLATAPVPYSSRGQTLRDSMQDSMSPTRQLSDVMFVTPTAEPKLLSPLQVYCVAFVRIATPTHVPLTEHA